MYRAAQRTLDVLRGLPVSLLGLFPRSQPRLLEERIRHRLDALGSQIRFLPHQDDLTGETAEMRLVYREMLREPSIKAAFLQKVLTVAQLDLTVQAASASERDQSVAQFVKHALTRAKGGTPHVLWNILWRSTPARPRRTALPPLPIGRSFGALLLTTQN